MSIVVDWKKVTRTTYSELGTVGVSEQKYWVYTKSGKIYIARYEWRQGWYPDVFITDSGFALSGKEVTHIAEYSDPQPPVLTDDTVDVEGDE